MLLNSLIQRPMYDSRPAWTPRRVNGIVLWLRAGYGYVSGGMGAVTATGTTPPTVTLEGVPNGSYQLEIEITGAGARGTATYRARLSATSSWEFTGLTAASVVLTGTGVTAVFATGSYATDNRYTAESAASQWSDQSGVGNHVIQPVLNLMPTTGAKALNFSSTSCLYSPTQVSTHTFFAVTTRGNTSAGTVCLLGSHADRSQPYWIMTNTGRLRQLEVSGYLATINSSNTLVRNIITSTLQFGDCYISDNLSEATAVSSGVTQSTHLVIRAIGADGAYGWGGSQEEIIMYNRPLSIEERRLIRGYLAAQHGIAITQLSGS